jgi:hypothetical protein
MNREFLDLRDKGFRDYILERPYNYNNFKLSFKDETDLVSFLMKEDISDNDLIRLYLILGNILDIFLFDYKMSRISGEQLDKFLEIFKEETGVITRREMGGITYDALSYWTPVGKFEKLVDIFLDEV